MEGRYITSFKIITILEVKFNLPLHYQALEIWYVIGSSSIITYMDGKLWTNFEHKQTCRLVLESIHHLSILNVVNGYMVKLVWALYSCVRELQDWAICPLLPHMQHRSIEVLVFLCSITISIVITYAKVLSINFVLHV
jgi:hypothetical protein